MFEIKFNAKLESDREKKDVDRTFAIISALKPTKYYVEKEMGSSVSLIHTIMSLVDFERRMGIDKNNHPSRRYKLGGVYYLNLEEWQVEDGIKGEILERSRENILTEQNRQS